MMARYYTGDRQWRATDKIRDGAELIQLDRFGAGGWIWYADLSQLTEAAQYLNPARFNIAPGERRPKWNPRPRGESPAGEG